MPLLLIGIATGLSTLIGGALALRYKDKIQLVLGFSAGAVIGVAFFDLMPETIGLASKFYSYSLITGLIATGFLAYMLLDRLILIFTTEESGHRGHVGAGSLSVHSFLDGLGIGLAFQVSVVLGGIVALAVLAHDFSDGINTVNISLFGTGKPNVARKWLIVDALAPIAGIIVTLFIKVPEQQLSLILALFCGFFLYIGASELLPDSHHRYPRFITTILTIVGALVILAAVHFSRF